MKFPIMDGFQILRCLWKRLDITLQSIILKISKTKNKTKKRPPKVKEKSKTYIRTQIKKFYKTDSPISQFSKTKN